MVPLAGAHGGSVSDEGTPRPIVLIVEDDARIADFMRRGLRASGFEVEWVTTAYEARHRIVSGGIAVQVLDLGLPDMDGLTLLRELREAGASVTTVIVTARSDPRYRADAVALGVQTYLTKPFAWADLLAAVREAAGVAAER
jgi:two-component system copper resistance phosphate regulon response regulator CusR